MAGIKLGVLGLLLLAAQVVHNHGADAFEIVTIATVATGAIVYVVMQIRDYRPNKRLREDLLEARHDNDRLQATVDAQKVRMDELERSRDFETAFKELAEQLRDRAHAAKAERLAISQQLTELLRRSGTGDNELAAQISALSNVISKFERQFERSLDAP
jgi:hypothetical protein